jgi:hypothetical protein
MVLYRSTRIVEYPDDVIFLVIIELSIVFALNHSHVTFRHLGHMINLRRVADNHNPAGQIRMQLPQVIHKVSSTLIIEFNS